MLPQIEQGKRLRVDARVIRSRKLPSSARGVTSLQHVLLLPQQAGKVLLMSCGLKHLDAETEALHRCCCISVALFSPATGCSERLEDLSFCHPSAFLQSCLPDLSLLPKQLISVPVATTQPCPSLEGYICTVQPLQHCSRTCPG